MLKWLDGILDEEDLTRIRMGRFSEADEREIRKLMATGGTRLWNKLIGFGVDLRVPASPGPRSQMAGGGETFSFATPW